MKSPFFSIIIPTYNAVTTISTCLESVLNQTLRDFEIIIIDGVSTDETLPVLHQYQLLHSQIRFLSERDDGIYDAMNRGIKIANGDWLYFLGSDDYLFDEMVLEDVCRIITQGKLHLIYGNVNSPLYGENYDGVFDVNKIIQKNVCHQSVFYKKSLFKNHMYNQKYAMLADWDFNLRCFLNPLIKKLHIPRVIAFHASDGLSTSVVDNEFSKDFYKLISKYLIYNPRYKIISILRKSRHYDIIYKFFKSSLIKKVD